MTAPLGMVRLFRTTADSARLEGAVAWVFGVNAADGVRGNELDRDGTRLNATFVSNVVDVVAAGVNKTHALGVDGGLAVGVVAFVGGYRSGGDDDQAMARV